MPVYIHDRAALFKIGFHSHRILESLTPIFVFRIMRGLLEILMDLLERLGTESL
jgi:hypothetical protein